MSAEFKSGKVEFFLSCADLTDPAFVCVFLKDTTQKWIELGRTEVSYHQNAKYTKQFITDYKPEEEQQFRFDVSKSNGNNTLSTKDIIGNVSFKLHEAVNAKSQMMTRTLTKGRKVVKNRQSKRYTRLNIRLEPLNKDFNLAEYRFCAQGLPKQGTFVKANPILEVHRLGSDGHFFKVFETSVVKKSLSPMWPEFTLTGSRLCNGDQNRPLQLKIFHVVDNAQRKYIAKCQHLYDENILRKGFKGNILTYNKLLYDENKSYTLKDVKGKHAGTLTLKIRELSKQQTEEKTAAEIEKHGFSNFGALGELLAIIDSHMLFMSEQETNVDEFINNSGSVDLLRAAKNKALETERELMQQIMNISEINTFLNNIILIENLFNLLYTKELKQKQEAARTKYAINIQKYEARSKPECNISSFVELMFAGTNLHISSFKKWLSKLAANCQQNGVGVVESSGARGKNIERAFYKSFYVYAVTYGNDGFKQMTDVLRCSLVFDNFDDLYQCFALIEQLAAETINGNVGHGILRCKDRFNPMTVPFGYRDMLINIYCPGSKVVTEIQLHHELFYARKKISHIMYKKARLFEEGDENMAYKYADQHIRKVIGDKIYEEDAGIYDEDESDEEVDEKNIFQQHECEMNAEQLFEKWKLTKYTNSFICEEGYDDPNLWKDISLDELRNDYGFKGGHAKKFIAYVEGLETQRDEFEEIKKQRAKIKKIKQKDLLDDNDGDVRDGNDGNGELKQLEESNEFKVWFCTNINLKELSDKYYSVLVENGFDSFNTIKDITHDDLKEIGIAKLGHRKIIIREAQQIQ